MIRIPPKADYEIQTAFQDVVAELAKLRNEIGSISTSQSETLVDSTVVPEYQTTRDMLVEGDLRVENDLTVLGSITAPIADGLIGAVPAETGGSSAAQRVIDVHASMSVKNALQADTLRARVFQFTEAHGGVYVNVNGITATANIIAWQAPYKCNVVAVRGYRVGGTSASINARKNGSSNHLSSALSLSSADTWMDGGAVQNVSYNADDKLEIMLTAVAGSPTQIGVQVLFQRV